MEQENIIEDTGDCFQISPTPVIETPVETPVIETPVIETPVIEIPIVEISIVEPSIVETPIVETPVIEIPIVEIPIVETPIVEPSIVEPSIVEPSIVEPSIVETPIVEPSIVERPVIEIPIVEFLRLSPTELSRSPAPSASDRSKPSIVETHVETPIIETPVVETPVIDTVKVTTHNSGWSGWFSRLFFSNKEAPIIIEKTPEKELPIMEDVSIGLVEPPVSINDVAVQITPLASADGVQSLTGACGFGSLQIPEIKNENTVITEKTKIIKSEFILAIEGVLDSTEKQEKYIIKTDDDMKTLLQKLIQTKPTVFDSIEQTIKNIVSNVSVDSKDIPNLMLLLVEIYEFSFQLKNKNNIIDLCGKTLKFCINVIIEEKIIHHENAKDFIKNIHNLIDTGVNLIKLNKDLKKKGKGKDKGKQSLSVIVFELFCNKNTK